MKVIRRSPQDFIPYLISFFAACTPSAAVPASVANVHDVVICNVIIFDGAGAKDMMGHCEATHDIFHEQSFGRPAP